MSAMVHGSPHLSIMAVNKAFLLLPRNTFIQENPTYTHQHFLHTRSKPNPTTRQDQNFFSYLPRMLETELSESWQTSTCSDDFLWV